MERTLIGFLSITSQNVSKNEKQFIAFGVLQRGKTIYHQSSRTEDPTLATFYCFSLAIYIYTTSGSFLLLRREHLFLSNTSSSW